MKKLIAVAAIAALASGCISVHKNDGANDCLKPAIAKDIVHEKYEIGETQVKASESLNVLFGFISWGKTATHFADGAPYRLFNKVDEAKNGAYANACDKAQCDAIVGAHYTLTVNDYFVFKKISCDVSGYPAKLTGVELIENKTPCACKK